MDMFIGRPIINQFYEIDIDETHYVPSISIKEASEATQTLNQAMLSTKSKWEKFSKQTKKCYIC